MHPLAHHAGEQALTPLLLLLAGGGLTLLRAIGRARLAAARAWLAGKQGWSPHPDYNRQLQGIGTGARDGDRGPFATGAAEETTFSRFSIMVAAKE